jgi:hypothetical protein
LNSSRLLKKAAIIFVRSFQKQKMRAAAVARCKVVSKTSGCSTQPGIPDKITKCPEEETGRNSAIP